MIDTNILLDWLLDRYPSHTKILDSFFSQVNELYVPDIIIVELVFVLQTIYKFPRDVIALNVHKVLDEPLFKCSRALFSKAIIEYTQHPAWSFVDSCLIHYSDLQKVHPVWTFDKKLVGQSKNKAQIPA